MSNSRCAGREVEAGERRPADREVGAELDDPGDGGCSTGLDLDADLVADREVLLVGDTESITISSGPGQSPSTRRSGLNGESPLRDREAEVRRAAVDDRTPSLPINDVESLSTPPSASATRKVAHLVEERLARVGSVTPLPSERSNADLPEMTTFEPSRMSVKIWSNALSIESVRTKVPLIIATPSTMASAVSAVRSFRVNIPLSANFGAHS